MRPTRTSRVGPQIQVADRVIKEAHGTGGIFTVSDILARSSNVGRGADRPAARREALRPLGAPFGFGQLTDLPLPGESPGIVPQVQDYSGLVDREPADRPGPRGDADPDGATPTRRSPTAACWCKPRLVLDGEPAAQGDRVISDAHARRAPAHARGRAGPDRHRARGGRGRLRHRGQDRHGREGRERRATPRTSSSPRSSASRRRDDAKLLVAVIVDEPKAAHYGRRGRRARVREDRQLRASLPRHRPEAGVGYGR